MTRIIPKNPKILTRESFPDPKQVLNYLVNAGVTYRQISSIIETTAGNILTIAKGNDSNTTLCRRIDSQRSELEDLIP